jgi:ubiquinone/menaquinone biosynthesis C-methylase UbiE
MTMCRNTVSILVVLWAAAPAWAAEDVDRADTAHLLSAERSLPARQPCVADDALRLCKPDKGFWVDLGAGKGQVALALIAKAGNPVLMIDPDTDAMQKGLQIAREKGCADRLLAVPGRAESLPLLDDSVDFLVSRGSIFFWDDPVKGLKEVYRVLRPGAKAYIGGGAGSAYPKDALEKLVRSRRQKSQGEQAGKWKRFVELRRPEQMQKWAQDAGLKDFRVLGQGALSADDPQVGQGVWLLLVKQPGS